MHRAEMLGNTLYHVGESDGLSITDQNLLLREHIRTLRSIQALKRKAPEPTICSYPMIRQAGRGGSAAAGRISAAAAGRISNPAAAGRIFAAAAAGRIFTAAATSLISQSGCGGGCCAAS
jgi:hypothetical protein